MIYKLSILVLVDDHRMFESTLDYFLYPKFHVATCSVYTTVTTVCIEPQISDTLP